MIMVLGKFAMKNESQCVSCTARDSHVSFSLDSVTDTCYILHWHSVGKVSVWRAMTAFVIQLIAMEKHTLTLKQLLASLPFNLRMLMLKHPEEFMLNFRLVSKLVDLLLSPFQSVHPSVPINITGEPLDEFRQNLMLQKSTKNLSKHLHFYLNWTCSTTTLHEDLYVFLHMYRFISTGKKFFWTNIVQKKKNKHISYPIRFSPVSLRILETVNQIGL
jgi:hypothetical protein